MRRLVFSISMALAAAFGATAASADGNLSAAAATEGNVVWSLESVVSSVLSDNTLVVTEGFLFQGKDAFDGVAAVEKTGMAVRVWLQSGDRHADGRCGRHSVFMDRDGGRRFGSRIGQLPLS